MGVDLGRHINGPMKSATVTRWQDTRWQDSFICDLTTSCEIFWVCSCLNLCMQSVLVALKIFISFGVNLIWQAAQLLGHPHLQPYVLEVHLKINSPRRGSLPAHWPEPVAYMKKTRLSETKDVPLVTYREKCSSFSNDRTLNPSISGAEQDSLCSTLDIHDKPNFLDRRLQELSVGSIHEQTAISKTVVAKASDVVKSSRRIPAKASGSPKRSESVRSG